MYIMHSASLLVVLVLAVLTAGCSGTTAPLATVAHVDLKRYAGTWYEIARLPNSFQKSCACNVTATYVLCEDGTVDVINQCEKSDGSRTESRGKAEVVDAQSFSKLRVSFLPWLLRWTGIGWGDYWIVDLDADYTTVVVASPNRSYAWILSRTPIMAAETRARVLQVMRDRGLAVDALQWIVQK